MPVYNEGRATGEFILSEAAGKRSRDNVTIASGAGILAAGTVLGQITAIGKYVASAVGASDGSQVAKAVLLAEVDATSADVAAVALTRDCEVNGNILTYAADRDLDAEKTAANVDLAGAGIIVR